MKKKKKCRRCEKDKPLKEFYAQERTCKKCRSEIKAKTKERKEREKEASPELYEKRRDIMYIGF